MSNQLTAAHLTAVYRWFAKTSLPRTLAAEHHHMISEKEDKNDESNQVPRQRVSTGSGAR